MKRLGLYRTQAEHAVDCERFPFNKIPRRTFIDTNIIDCLVKWPECIFEQQDIPPDAGDKLQEDIESLMHIFHVGSRADWGIVTSNTAIEELSKTKDKELREKLLEYGIGFAANGSHDEDFFDEAYAADLARRLRHSSFLRHLPDVVDRVLISHAVAFGCDGFCTRDRRTIHSKKDTLRALPIRILTPAEWWSHIRPWAGLWC